jgi:hypothetical protein
VLTEIKANANPEGLYRVNYAFAKDSDFGRVYSGGKGYQALSSKMRTLCSSRFYAEDDMVNSFPTILNQIFNGAGLATPCLTAYVTQREDLLRDLTSFTLSREELKKLFLICLHLGDYLPCNDFVPIHFLSRFQFEIRSCAKKLLTIPEYASLHSRAISLSKRNPLSSMVAWICQREESKIMQAKTLFTERYYRVATNLFDGHLREIGDLDLADCSRFIEENTGFKVTFVTKNLTSAPIAIATPEVCSPSASTKYPVGGVLAIKGDGHCVLRLAGEISSLLRNPDTVLSMRATCHDTDLAHTNKFFQMADL